MVLNPKKFGGKPTVKTNPGKAPKSDMAPSPGKGKNHPKHWSKDAGGTRTPYDKQVPGTVGPKGK